MSRTLPKVIQGGMGVGVSSWVLARAVAMEGQLGVVSGTALDSVMLRRLQNGDPGRHIQEAIKAFPFPEVGERIYQKYFISEGKGPMDSFRRPPMPLIHPSRESEELYVLSNFVEVYLAKRGHSGLVGVNYLYKIQLGMLPSLYGAMLAGVDYVLIGAGIPRDIPHALDQLALHEPAEMRLQVVGMESGDDFRTTFTPQTNFGRARPPINRPNFLPIISSSVLALTMAKKVKGTVQGFVVENATAGGHNAPPRGVPVVNERGEPVYGEKDVTDLAVLRDLGLPFWLAGSFGSAEGLRKALSLGAAGIQVGTIFALCRESALSTEIKEEIMKIVREEEMDVFTDSRASPTGFPFKVAGVPGSLFDSAVYNARERVCDAGYLRQVYKRPDGKLGYRCPAEPEDQFVEKGGKMEDAVGRRCLCNGLLSNIGLAQVQANGSVEPPIVTIGDDVRCVRALMGPTPTLYSAKDVVSALLGKEANS